MFEGGGNIPLILPISRRLVERGHHVRILAGPTAWAARRPVSARFHERIAATGAGMVPFRASPLDPVDGLMRLRVLVRGWTPWPIAGLRGHLQVYRWARSWSGHVVAELRRAPTDALVADQLVHGAFAAGEASGVPTVALVHGIYKHRPAPGLPPYGAGLLPGRGLWGALRDTMYTAATERMYRRNALPCLNGARQQLGLQPLRSAFHQYDRIQRVLVLNSTTFDFPAHRLPANVRYVGTPFDDQQAGVWRSPWAASDPRPLVLASLSTLPQGQGRLMQHVLAALETLPVRALVTLGPSLDPAEFHPRANVVVERFVPHSAVLPASAALVSQCGIGTVMKGLAHGVPLICVPLRADQFDNAARVVARGAGLRLPAETSPEQIRTAIQPVLGETRFRAGARRMAEGLAGENGVETAADELEIEQDALPARQLRRSRRKSTAPGRASDWLITDVHKPGAILVGEDCLLQHVWALPQFR
jgi:UDP:flavonoid glycosyltransferase YjiC (YdhE family)